MSKEYFTRMQKAWENTLDSIEIEIEMEEYDTALYVLSAYYQEYEDGIIDYYYFEIRTKILISKWENSDYYISKSEENKLYEEVKGEWERSRNLVEDETQQESCDNQKVQIEEVRKERKKIKAYFDVLDNIEALINPDKRSSIPEEKDFYQAISLLDDYHISYDEEKDFYYYREILYIYNAWMTAITCCNDIMKVYNGSIDLLTNSVKENISLLLNEAKRGSVSLDDGNKEELDVLISCLNKQMKELKHIDLSNKNTSRNESANHSKRSESSESKTKGSAYQKEGSSCSSRQEVERKYYELISSLQMVYTQLNDLRGANKETIQLQRDLIDTLKTQIQEVRKEAEASLHNIAWDKLVIAFFGETNAGKSTIIETFRILFENNRKMNNDGLIVGDGQHDFTKEYNEYNLVIKGHPFTLIDVPGIEGNESEFKEIIKEALGKAHCVFYVQGHNKKPDSATANKIKQYLGDWVNVYSIQNVRGDVSYYDEEEERETLLTPNVQKNEKLIREEFQRILGKVYKGNISLQALLAMCAKASFSDKRQDLQKTQKKLISYFGTPDEILRFSQFQTIVNLVEDKSQNFLDEILAANKQKMYSLANRASQNAENTFNRNIEPVRELHSKLKEFKRDVSSIIVGTKSTLDSKVRNSINSQFSNLKTELFGIIDSGSDSAKEEAEYACNEFSSNLPVEIQEIISRELSSMKSKIESKKRTLQGFHRTHSFDNNVDVPIDIDVLEGMGELDINLEDVGDVALSTAGWAATGFAIGSVVPVIGNVVGAIAGASLGFLFGLGKKGFGDHGKGSAKNEVANSLDNAKSQVINSVSRTVNSIKSKLDTEKRTFEKEIEKELNTLEDLENAIDDIKKQMNSYTQKL